MRTKSLILIVSWCLLATGVPAEQEDYCDQFRRSVKQFVKKFENLSVETAYPDWFDSSFTDEVYHGPCGVAYVTVEIEIDVPDMAVGNGRSQAVFDALSVTIIPEGELEGFPCDERLILRAGGTEVIHFEPGKRFGLNLSVSFDHCMHTTFKGRVTRITAEILCDYEDFATCESCERIEAGGGGGGGGQTSLASGPSVKFAFGRSDPLLNESAATGVFSMRHNAPDRHLFNPQMLGYSRPASATELLVQTNVPVHLRQVRAADGLADVVTISTNQYEVRIYNLTNVLSKDASGFWQVTNEPMRTVTFRNPTPGTNDQLHVIFAEGQQSLTNRYFWNEPTQGWSLTRPDGLTEARTTCLVTNDGCFQIDTREVCTTNAGTLSFVEEVKRTNFLWGAEVTERFIGSAGQGLCTAYDYYTSTNDNGYGRLKTANASGGAWTYHTYDAAGRLKETLSAFANQAYTTNTNLCRWFWHDYEPLSGAGDVGADTNDIRTSIEFLLGKEIARSYWVYMSDGKKEIQCVTPGAAWDNSSNLVTTTRYYTNGSFNGWLKSVLYPDGTFTLHEYATNSTGRTNIVWSGQPNGSYTAVVAGTKTVSVLSTNGQFLSTSTYDVLSGILTGRTTYSNYDQWNRPGQVSYLDGTSQQTSYGCCGAESVTDREGVTTVFDYDALKRRTGEWRNGIGQLTAYDASGRPTTVTRQGTNGSTINLSRTVYDQAGRMRFQTNALGGVTSYTYGTNASGQLLTTVTNADGGTRVTLHYADGQVAKITGSAVYPVRFEYGVEQDGSVWRRYTKEIKLDASGTDTAEWTKTYTDALGRGYKIVFAGSGTPYQESSFNTKGQRWKERDPDGVITLYGYNALGQVAFTAIDSNRNDVIDFSGQDRITQTTNDVLASYGTNVVRTRTYVWETGGSSAATLLSRTETSVEGLRSWSTAYRDASTPVTTTNWTVFAGGGARYQTNLAADGSRTIRVHQDGRPQSLTRLDRVGTQLHQTSYQYDAHGRTWRTIDGRGGATTYTYNDADQVQTVTTPAPGTGQGAQTSLTLHNSMGQAVVVVHPDGASLTNEFYPNRLLFRTYGSRSYPVAYGYDAQGRLRHMTNWAAFPATGARVTTWNYDSERGWLVSKRYPDNLGPDYTHTPAGRLATRVWARGNPRISTTYGYNNAGELIDVNYSDSTPDVATGTDRRGRPALITQGTNTWKLLYNLAGQLLSEAGTAGAHNGLSVTNTYDAWLRRDTVSAKNGGSALTAHSYAYDGASRMTNAADGVYSASYSYLANSPLVSQITFRSNSVARMTTSKQYDLLNRLSSISSAPSAGSTVSFGYTYNEANQRVRAGLADGSYWLYQYDSLGQVISGKRYWSDGTPVAGQQFEYGFDEIGNRTGTKAGGDQFGSGLRASSYTNNSLNQITGRTVPGALDILGAATATSAVTVNGQSPYRRAEYYWKELTLNNSSAPVWQAVTNVATEGANSTGVTGNVYLAKSPELYTYDADGNTTADGHRLYTWNAENRLIEMKTIGGLPQAAERRLEFEYDWQGRRIRKRVYDRATGGTLIRDEKFLYDGWNLVAIVNGTTHSMICGFLWGLDLSGSMQGAGGVGGLIAVNSASGGVHFPAYDGNGNVAALVSAVSGSVSANYEYGPFAEPVRISGTMGAANPFRFSTKYQDDETGLLNYGYRYYNPSTGRWPSRDPIGERGGVNTSCFVANDAVNAFDLRGLFKPGVHGALLNASFTEAWGNLASRNPPPTANCSRFIRDRLVLAAASQDSQHLDENRRHYNRDVVSGETVAMKEAADWDYALYIGMEFGEFYNDLTATRPTQGKCLDALYRLGAITHSWQDFYAHAIRRDGRGGNENSRFPGWVAWSAGVTGDPENRENFWPSSYALTGGGEHPPIQEPLITGSAEYTARYNAALQYVAAQYNTYIPYWLDRCQCYCP